MSQTYKVSQTSFAFHPFVYVPQKQIHNAFIYISFLFRILTKTHRCDRTELPYPTERPDFSSQHHLTQLAITSSKLTIETLEQGVKYIQS